MGPILAKAMLSVMATGINVPPSQKLEHFTDAPPRTASQYALLIDWPIASISSHGQYSASISTVDLPVWHDRLERQIDSFALMPDGWDTYKSPRIDPKTILNAKRVLSAIAAAIPFEPEIAPVPGGGISFIYNSDSDEHEVEFELLPNGSLSVLLTLCDQTYEFDNVPIENLYSLKDRLERDRSGSSSDERRQRRSSATP